MVQVSPQEDGAASYAAIVARREEQAAIKQQALENRLKEIQERVYNGITLKERGPWSVQQEAKLGALQRLEDALYTLLQQFRFPFHRIWFTLPEGITWGGERSEVTVVQDLREHLPDRSGADLEDLWLPADVRMLLAQALKLA